MIEEGRSISIFSKRRTRSQQLRKAAIEYYSAPDKIIRCSVCHFSFEEYYGSHGCGFIEIHHEQPVCQYSREFETLLREAILFVKPVCSNCHRMLHRNKEKPLTIRELQSIISSNHTASSDET